MQREVQGKDISRRYFIVEPKTKFTGTLLAHKCVRLRIAFSHHQHNLNISLTKIIIINYLQLRK